MKKNTTLSFISTSIITLIATQANADMATGKAWLENQNNNNKNSSIIANNLQTNQETTQTLQLLQSSSLNNIDLSEQLKKERSTEGLVRIILLAHSQNQSIPQAWQYLKFNQNEDGGFAHIENWQSNPLDTAFFLIALHETDYLSTLNSESQAQWQTTISKALTYLTTQQREKGNYSIAHLDDLYTSSYVLSAFTPYLTDYSQYIPHTKKLVEYLETKQTAPATWSNQTNSQGLFLDALVAESLYPYQTSDKAADFSNAFKTRVLSLQNADGSWQQDSYTTALVLRATDRLSKPIDNPVMSSISLSVVDAETNNSLAGVSVKTDSTSAQITVASDAQGNVIIKDSKEGNYIFTLSKDGYAPVQLSLKLRRGERLNLGQVKLSRAESIGNGQIQGKVTDTKNNIIANATITVNITDADGKKLDVFEPIIVKTNPTGDYQVVLTDKQQESGGYFIITVAADGFLPMQGSGSVPAGGVMQFNARLLNQTESSASLKGVITNKSGNPIAGATIKTILVDDKGNQLKSFEPIITTTNADGSYKSLLFSGQHLDRSHFVIEITADEYISNKGTGSVQVGGTVIYSTVLNKETEFKASLTGKVVDSDGKPLLNVKVFSDKQNVLTNNSGDFSVDKLSTGMQKWTASKDGYHSASVSLLVSESTNYEAGTIVLYSVDEDDPKDDVTIGAKGNIKVSASDSQTHKEIREFTLVAEKLDKNGQVTQTQSYSSGGDRLNTELLLKDLATGKWQLTVSHPSYITQTKTFDLADSETLEYNPELVIKPYIVSGTVVDSQTNLPIGDAPFKIIDSDTGAILFDKEKTDSNGHFVLKDISATNINVEITPKYYLPTTRYISREYDSATNVDMGEIRLRPVLVGVVSTDLVISELDSSQLDFHQQLLTIKGTLTATIKNKGNDRLSAGNVMVTAWIDSNNDKKIDEDEQVLGKVSLTDSLAIDGSANVQIEIDDTVNFREAPIAVMVDSEEQVAEKDEKNNVRLTSNEAEIKPKQGNIEVEEVWMYGKNKTGPNYQFMAPVVAAPLNDSNLNKKIDNDDISTIVAVALNGRTVALNGKTGQEEWSFQIPSIPFQLYFLSPAIADIDNDKIPEILLIGNNRIHVLSSQGIRKEDILIPEINNISWKNPSILEVVDLDSDGYPELLIHDKVYSFKDSSIKDLKYEILLTANLHKESRNIISRTGIHSNTGELLFEFPKKINFASVGKVNNEPVIFTSNEGNLVGYNKVGEEIFNESVPCGGNLGAPTLSDFDSDGNVDVAVAGKCAYSVYRSDGSMIWSKKTIDLSSSVTGSTIFDFNNDGKGEVLYSDESNFKIYDSSSGDEIFTVNNGTGTAYEYPIVIDADNDNHADIIVTVNRHGKDVKPINGIRMFSSKNKDWANTRNIWNQYNYRVTNINDDLSIPKNEPNSWEVHNTYRANLLLNQNPTAASDLTASYIQVNDRSFLSDSTLTARIGNAGGKTVSTGTPISFYRIPPTVNGTTGTPELLQTATLSKELIAGTEQPSYEDISIKYNGSLADFGELIVVANDAGAGIDSATGIPTGADEATTDSVIQEYTRSNNIARLSIDGGFAGLTLTGEIDKPIYSANNDVTITAIPTNIGSFPNAPTVKTQIIDSAGNIIATLPEQKVDLTSALITDPENSKILKQTWNTSSNHVGAYTAHITLWRNPLLSSITGSEAEQVAHVDLPFTIIADAEIDPNSLTNSTLTVDKAQYLPTDQVQIHSRVLNTTSNAIATKRNVTITVTDPEGKKIWTQNYSHNKLIPNAIKDKYFTLPLSDSPKGNYIVTQTTTAPDGSQETQVQTQTFTVQSAADTGYGITGAITAPTQVQVGEIINWSWQVNNTSDTNLKDIPLSIALFKEDSTEPFNTIALSSINIDKDGNITGKTPWTSIGEDGTVIQAILIADFKGNKKGIAQTKVTLTKADDETKVTALFNDPTANDNTLLVYYGCNDGWSNAYRYHKPSSSTCLENRKITLERYLKRQDIDYTLVQTADEFTSHMQSGIYEQYWIVGAKKPLNQQTQSILSELTYSGDNLYTDASIFKWSGQGRSNTLGDIAGARFINWLQLNNGSMAGDIVTLSDYMSQPTDSIIRNTQLNTKLHDRYSYFSRFGLQLQATNNATQMWSGYGTNGYQHCSYLAIAGAEHGIGTPLTSSFDLLGSLQMATKTNLPPYSADGIDNVDNPNALEQHWDSVLTDILAPRVVQNNTNAPTDYVPNDVVTIPLSLTNESTVNATIQVDIHLPDGSQWLGYSGGSDGTVPSTATEQHYQITLKPNQTLNDVITLRLPKATGTNVVKVTVNDITNGKPKEIDSYEARFLVRDISTRTQLIVQTLNTWRVYNYDYYSLYYAKQSANNLNRYADSQYTDYSLKQALYMVKQIDKIRSVKADTRQKLRLEVDELIRAIQIKQYQANQ